MVVYIKQTLLIFNDLEVNVGKEQATAEQETTTQPQQSKAEIKAEKKAAKLKAKASKKAGKSKNSHSFSVLMKMLYWCILGAGVFLVIYLGYEAYMTIATETRHNS